MGLIRRALVVAAFLCASTAVHAQEAMLWLKYGVGGYSTSSGMGPGKPTLANAIANKFGASIKIVGYAAWTDNISAAMNAVPSTVKLMEIGYSCGASEVPLDAAAVRRRVDFAGGIQASVYCGSPYLSANVMAATEIYNPYCIQTLGLGCSEYTPGPGFAPGRLTIVQEYDLHPYADQDPAAWSVLTAAIGNALNPKPKATLGNAVHRYVRARQTGE